MGELFEATRRYDEAFNAQDADARMGCLSDDAEVMLPGGMVVSGRDQVVALARTFWEALPDGRISTEFELSGGDAVVTEGTLSGTHTGTFNSPAGEVPASGNRVSFRYVSIKRVRDDRVAAEHLYFDQLDFLQQIGALPAAHGTGARSVV
jgi:steroid delta-isomerase-like uncharacterized protein